MIWRVVVFVFLLVGIGESLPTTRSEEESLEVVNNLQAPGLLSDKWNYTCTECERMQSALLDVCKWNHHLSKPFQRDFHNHCTDLAGPASTSGKISEKCEAFYSLVEKLYCPLDPCVALTNQLNAAPTAICGLLECEVNLEQPVVVLPNEPLTCPVYVDFIRDACKNAMKLVETGAVDPPEVSQLCYPFNPHFEREGCNVVGNAMWETVSPMALCAAMSCDDEVDAARFCTETLNMTDTSRVFVHEYETFLLRQNKSAETEEGLGEGEGINILRASLGSSCADDYSPYNNVLDAVRKTCQTKVTCVLPNPSLNSELTQVPFHNECDGSFTIHYRCSGSKKHRIFAPTNTTYESLTIDCSRELQNSHPFGSRQFTGSIPLSEIPQN